MTTRVPITDTGPGRDPEAVTKSDSVNYTDSRVARALYVGTGGNVSLLVRSGTTVVFNNVPSGAILPVWHTRVNTATTAADMVALF